MNSESQNHNQPREDQWSLNWWKTQHSNQANLIDGKFYAQSDHHALRLFDEEPGLLESNEQELNRKAKRKRQNNLNAKKSRERKKEYFEQIQLKNALLEKENQQLRNQEVCWRCSKSLHQSTASQLQCQHLPANLNPKKVHQEQFIFKELQNKKQQRRAKLWIAIGLVMLILGLQIHGIYGSQEHLKISKVDLDRWKEHYNHEQTTQLSIRMKTKPSSLNAQKTKGQSFLDRLSIEDEEEYAIEEEGEEEEKYTLDKDLLSGIDAELEGIGRDI